MIDGVDKPLFQIPPTFPERVTLSPTHIVVGPEATMVDAAGGNPPGIVTKLSANEMAPAVESPLPLRIALLPKLIAPCTNKVPTKTDVSHKATAPFICQKTLHKDAELIKLTLDKEVVDKAPSI